MCDDGRRLAELHASSQRVVRELIIVLGEVEGAMVPTSQAERVGGTRIPGPPGDLKAAKRHREMCDALSGLHRETLGKASAIIGGTYDPKRRGPRLSKGAKR